MVETYIFIRPGIRRESHHILFRVWFGFVCFLWINVTFSGPWVAIIQLTVTYRTVVQFPNFDILLGTHVAGSYGSISCGVYHLMGTGLSEDIFNFLAIEGPTRGEGKPRIEPISISTVQPATFTPPQWVMLFWATSSGTKVHK